MIELTRNSPISNEHNYNDNRVVSLTNQLDFKIFHIGPSFELDVPGSTTYEYCFIFTTHGTQNILLTHLQLTNCRCAQALHTVTEIKV